MPGAAVAEAIEDKRPGDQRRGRPGGVLSVAAAGRLMLIARLASTAAAAFVVACAVAIARPAVARADGDPGSDVLVYQDLFAGSDAGLSVQQQVALGGVLKAAARKGFPIRVAIIASPHDLGAVTELWRKPRAYARFLGIELSLAYKQRLLVVMPNGFGFNWPGHSTSSWYRLLSGIAIRAGGGGLFGAASTAVRKLAAANGIKLASTVTTPTGSAPAQASSSNGAAPANRSATDDVVGLVALVLAVLALAVVGLVWALRRRGWRRPRVPAGWWSGLRSARVAIPGATLVLALVPITLLVMHQNSSRQSQAAALAGNPDLDPGTPIHGAAADFRLSDQFGQPVSLRSYRGKVVILAFNDSECTTVCPLTTTAMMDAKAMLGKAGSRVQLLGVDANPAATSVEDVWSYSELHGMLRAWQFLTGSLPQLKQVWKRYGIEAAIQRGQITHTPALFVIDPRGRLSRLYMTQMSFTAVPQLGQLLARSASALLPGHPAVHADLSYARVQPTTPRTNATLARAGGGSLQLGPGRGARLFLFFATWDKETSGLAGQLDALNRYQALAARSGLPKLAAVDEASVEPSPGTLTKFLHGLRTGLSYPVAIDRSGKIADGYQVQGLPWFVLISASGQILYYREVSVAGWPTTSVLARFVRAALARAPKIPGAATANQDLAGSPPILTVLHRQAGQLLGGSRALTARLRSLRGYPVVINAWASWCAPCKSEFGLFASASARYGRRVAFLGADTNDSPGDARTFLAQHPVSYPSYQTTTTSLTSLAAIEGLPTTIFLNPAHKVTYVHIGQYDAQGTLDQDIRSHAQPAATH
jgi:cytochrome oxidase Cu insertion factor (SCO1/SenC/PrrC family)/thiol-disulfide isomerase/thioredoxin